MASVFNVAPLHIRSLAFIEGKLDGSSYTMWNFNIGAILDSYELLDTLMGSIEVDLELQPMPDPANPAQTISPNAVAL